ncbi:unnamed protein product [Chironomus riparius]|uniref:SCP domain-containing protein n=1 Tax=Chironomus riparius TaxID=315576 RepID=A0A9N9S9J7_9DIPT|nr:unnamed protein product [Chironomus riparius]
MLKLIIITISIGLASTTVYNYCSHNLCSLTEYKHITCTATGDLSPSCSSNAQIIDLTGADKKKILDLHNRYRNRIANGDESGFSSAAKMATLEWDDDLADYAGLNVRRCRDEHDCHNTPEMKYSGQNLFFEAKTDTFERDISSFIDSAFQSWWDERTSASQDDINSCCGAPGKIPHFLMVVSDRANRVGCALSQYEGPYGKTTYIACNYSFTIITGQAVYETGEPASKCQTGANAKYPALCSSQEEVDPNKVF